MQLENACSSNDELIFFYDLFHFLIFVRFVFRASWAYKDWLDTPAAIGDGENDDDEAAAESTDTTTTQGQHYLLLQQLLNCTHRLPHLGPTASEKQDKQSLPFLSFHDFLALIPNSMCRNDPHFQPQAQRMEHKYWKYINFIGHMETISTDVEQLLKQVGAWDDYGASGWPNTNQAIFASSTTVHHKTDASSKLQDYYAPGSETLAMATKLCEQDYAIIPGLQNKIR
jgi:hypothetical protein